jgi:hypothetical protein
MKARAKMRKSRRIRVIIDRLKKERTEE